MAFAMGYRVKNFTNCRKLGFLKDFRLQNEESGSQGGYPIKAGRPVATMRAVHVPLAPALECGGLPTLWNQREQDPIHPWNAGASSTH